MSSPVCSKCGATNSPSAAFCSNCGSPLAPAPPVPARAPPAFPGQYPSPATSYAMEAAAYERQKRVGRTKTGLLLMIIGSILGPLPIIGIVGGLLLLVGAIMVILGRQAFGNPHARNIIWSVVIYIVGLVVGAVFAVGFALSIISAAVASNPSGLADAIAANFNTLLIGIIVGSAITGVAYVLFTYALQLPAGRFLLWAAYATSLAISTITFVVIGPQINDAVQDAVSSGTFNRAPIDALRGQMQGLQLLGIIPGVLYGVAFYMAWSRINKGEIPQMPPSPSVPGTPTPAAPF